ncbi:MAG: hypothetical protein KKC68_03205 [Candidatus Thermoplasmatota archaeon]|nr:hypothetical protein [Candidatus Thermoplasmatota archaeon]MBU1940760.1 hypothetical protein [Candidatus Thermoplasmatota archaeon]
MVACVYEMCHLTLMGWFISRRWDVQDSYTIRCKARDVYSDESDWGMLEIQIPYPYGLGWQWFQLHFPLLTRLLKMIDDLLIK